MVMTGGWFIIPIPTLGRYHAPSFSAAAEVRFSVTGAPIHDIVRSAGAAFHPTAAEQRSADALNRENRLE